MAYRILIVDDENELQNMVKDILTQAGYETDAALSCAQAMDRFQAGNPDAVLLDINLPDGDGFSLFRQFRKSRDVPILFLSARDEDADRLRGLGLGADDYISKPFRPRELVSRMRSVLRRAGCANHMTKVGDLNVDVVKGVVTRKGEEIFLSALEYRLLLVFLNHRGTVLSRGQLLEEIWDIAGEYVNDNTLTVYIKRLREKIEKDAQNPEIIKTVRGMGYRMET